MVWMDSRRCDSILTRTSSNYPEKFPTSWVLMNDPNAAAQTSIKEIDINWAAPSSIWDPNGAWFSFTWTDDIVDPGAEDFLLGLLLGCLCGVVLWIRRNHILRQRHIRETTTVTHISFKPPETWPGVSLTYLLLQSWLTPISSRRSNSRLLCWNWQ